MIYLDNAATTFPKPRTVIREVVSAMSEYGGNPGRGGHALSLAAAKKVFECRCELSDLFGVGDPSRIIFTQNTTHALNLVIKGILKKGDHVIISDLEHNSVLRPIYKMAKEGLVEYSILSSGVLEEGRDSSLILAELARLVRPNTRLVVATHHSNICSETLPIADIGALCKRLGILFAVDAAQSAGVLPIDMEKMNIDALCVPSHKGLYGPQGSGFAALREGLSISTLTEGGSGTNSLDGNMPDASPERYEAGTLATPVIAGLSAGVKFIKKLGLDELRFSEAELFCLAREKLMNIRGVKLIAPHHVGSVLLFKKEGLSPEELAAHLDSEGICTRAGYHCAPLAHKALGTLDEGALRVSFGIFNTRSDVDSLAAAVMKA